MLNSLSRLGMFSVEIKPKLSVSELCEASCCDIRHALDTACEYIYELITGWFAKSSLGTFEQEDKETFKDVMLRQAHLMKVPANLSVAQTHLRIDSVRIQWLR